MAAPKASKKNGNTKRVRFAKAVRHGVKLAKSAKKDKKVDVEKVLDALEKALKDAGDENVTAFELALALARKIDEGIDLGKITLPTKPPISLELLDGPVVFLIALGMVLWYRKKQKAKKDDVEPTEAEIEAAAEHAEAMGHPDIGELPQV